MAFKSGLFMSTSYTVVNGIAVGNKAMSTAQLAKRFYHLYGDGISLKPTSAFYVQPKSGLIATVKAGWGIMSGYDFELDADLDITMNSSTSEQTLYIGVRLDVANGEYTGNNVVARTTFVPATDRVFAIIIIPANAVTLTTAMISDKRSYPEYCGTIDSQRLALTDIYNEYRDALNVLNSTGIPIHHDNHAYGGSDPIPASSIGQYGVAALGSDGKVASAHVVLGQQSKSANYTLAAGDENKMTQFTATATATIPAGVFPVGTIIPLCVTAGTLTVAAGSNVSLIKVRGYASAAATAVMGLEHMYDSGGTEYWAVVGGTAA